MASLVTLLLGCAGPLDGSEEQPAQGVGDPKVLAAVAPPVEGEDAVVLGHTPKNLLVISLDTTRRDRVGFFNPDLDATPNLVAAFQDGVILQDHRSCSNWTAPSTYCAQAGRSMLDDDAWQTSGSRSGRDSRVPWPARNAPTLASILRDAGYDTTLVTTNAYFSSVYNGNAYGFDHVVKRFWQNADSAIDAATTASEDLGSDGNPWYFHVHFFDPHENYEAPRAYWTDPRLNCPWDIRRLYTQYQLEAGGIWWHLDDRGREMAQECLYNIYEGDLRFWDERFGAMWSDFESRGLLDDTLVVFWTDHGQSFGEHDDKFNHGVTLYDTENRSTAAFWAKDIEPLRWMGPTEHQDLAPTILHALRVPLGDHTGHVVGHAHHDRVRVAFDYLQGYSIPIISAVQGDKKLMYWWDGTKRFYDIGTDPDEQTDLYDASDPDVIALWDELEPIVEHTDEVWPGLDPKDVGP
jgi:arylsulfatase A-like enzyme